MSSESVSEWKDLRSTGVGISHVVRERGLSEDAWTRYIESFAVRATIALENCDKLTNNLVNNLLFKYDNDHSFGVREFRTALAETLGIEP